MINPEEELRRIPNTPDKDKEIPMPIEDFEKLRRNLEDPNWEPPKPGSEPERPKYNN